MNVFTVQCTLLRDSARLRTPPTRPTVFSRVISCSTICYYTASSVVRTQDAHRHAAELADTTDNVGEQLCE